MAERAIEVLSVLSIFFTLMFIYLKFKYQNSSEQYNDLVITYPIQKWVLGMILCYSVAYIL